MLLELDGISGRGAQIDFARDDDDNRVPRLLNRPLSLHLPTRTPAFHPTLPATPENTVVQNKNHRNVFETKRIERTSVFDPCLYDILQKNTNFKSKDVRTADACCFWLAKRWHKLRRKSPSHSNIPRTTRSLKIFDRPTTSSLHFKRRSATISYPISYDLKEEKENKRDWGEERHDDVIYKVVLKKVERIPAPSTDEQADGLQYVTQKVRYIKGATLSHLVGALCRSQTDVDEFTEANFLTVFFSTYRSFTNATEVLDLIVREKDGLKIESIEKRRPVLRSILHVLRTWLEKYFLEDFYCPPQHSLLKRLHGIAEELCKDEAIASEEGNAFDIDCDLLTFTKSMLQNAEVKSLQEKCCETLPPIFSDMLDETDDLTVEKDSAQNFLQNTFTPQLIAEQLTIKDADLFVELVPHHSLKCARSSKEKPATVKATIDQFNKVVYCVLGTCLSLSIKMSQRAKVIAKWIDVAKACFELRNFSSLRAIVSSLLAYPVHRLKKTWNLVSSTHISQLDVLNKINPKDLLTKVPYGQFQNDTTGSRQRKDAMVRRNQTVRQGAFSGTVPYLGSFLTDLIYLDTAKPDYIEMKKEYEMLSQLQLWQTTCRSFRRLETDQRFSDWFNSVTLPTDEQANEMSNEIERQLTTSPVPGTPVKQALTEMLANHVLDLGGMGTSILNHDHRRSSSNELSQHSLSDNEANHSRANGQVPVETISDEEGRTVNVQIITKLLCTIGLANTSVPKEMKLSSNDRCPSFVKKAFSRFDMEDENMKDYQLVQILPDNKELLITESDNVYYAMNSSTGEYNFVLLEQGAEIPKKEIPINPSLTLPRKSKKIKNYRKTLSTSSMSTPSSPMKNINRQLGISGIVLAGLGHSPVKDDKLSQVASDNQTRKKSLDDSIFSSNTNSSDESFGEEVSTLKRVKKFIKRTKSNHGDSGTIRSRSKGRADKIQFVSNKQSSFESGDTAPSSGKRESDSDPDQVSVNSTSREQFSLDSHRTTTVDTASVDAIQLIEDKTSIEQSEKNKNGRSLRKCESRSKFYVSFNHSQSSASLESPDLAEGDLNASGSSLTRPFSDSCLLDKVAGENEVFVEGPPLITVQCPTPNKTDDQANFSNEKNTDEEPRRGRIASETRTTYL